MLTMRSTRRRSTPSVGGDEGGENSGLHCDCLVGIGLLQYLRNYDAKNDVASTRFLLYGNSESTASQNCISGFVP